MSKYIIICGGVISGCGKGVASASIALLLKLRGHKINYIKMDPYLSVNSGVLNPQEHGETYVLDDGWETDLDLGHLERIAAIPMSRKNICTAGTLYKEVIVRQEKGEWLGRTLQTVPHLTNLIQQRISDVDAEADVVIIEIGGTVGDIESAAFYEAIRQFKHQHDGDVLIVMVAPILWIPTINEYKTKPLQNAVKQLQQCGINPDILLCRVDKDVSNKILNKVAEMTGVDRESIFNSPDVSSIYQVPVEFYDRHIDDAVVDLLHLKRTSCRIHKHKNLINKQLNCELTVAVFGKYDNADSYISIKEALFHAGMGNNCKINIHWIKSDDLETANDIDAFFQGVNAAIVPGGFDNRGIEGKIKAIKYVREHKIPFLGICLGLQCAVIEAARNVCKLNANSTEFDKDTPNPVIHYVKGQESISVKSASMRLGAYDCHLTENSLALDVYGKKMVSERHRHRYEVNDEYVDGFAKNGFVVSGRNPGSNLIEIMELDRKIHPYFIGTQSHPEFKSSLTSPSSLFVGLLKAALTHKQKISNG